MTAEKAGLPGGAEGRLDSLHVGNSLLVHLRGRADRQTRNFAAGIPGDSRHQLVVLDLPADSTPSLWDEAAALLSRQQGSFRVVSGRQNRVGDLPLGQWLAERTGRTVIAPDGVVQAAMGGVLFVPTDSGSGWVCYRPGRPAQRVAQRFPEPLWEPSVAAQPWQPGPGTVAEPLPAGIWLRPRLDESAQAVHRKRLVFRLRARPDLLALVVGAPSAPPVPVKDVARVYHSVQPSVRSLVRFLDLGPVTTTDGESLGQSLADRLGHAVVVYAGIPSVRAAEGWEGVQVPHEDGSAGWQSYAHELRYVPRRTGERPLPPALIGHRRPVDGLPEIAPGVYEYETGAAIEVVQSGLWMRPLTEPVDAEAIRRQPPDPRYAAFRYSADGPDDGRMARLAEDALRWLDPMVRERFRVLSGSATVESATVAAGGSVARTATEAPAPGPGATSMAPAPGPGATSMAPAPGPGATAMAPAPGPGATAMAPAPGPGATSMAPPSVTASPMARPSVGTDPAASLSPPPPAPAFPSIRLESGPGTAVARADAPATAPAQAPDPAALVGPPVRQTSTPSAGPGAAGPAAPPPRPAMPLTATEAPATAAPASGPRQVTAAGTVAPPVGGAPSGAVAPPADETRPDAAASGGVVSPVVGTASGVVAPGAAAAMGGHTPPQPAGPEPAEPGLPVPGLPVPVRDDGAAAPPPPSVSSVRLQPAPPAAACAVPPDRGTGQEREWLRTTYSSQYDAIAASVARMLSQSPGLRGGDSTPAADLVTDFVAVRMYLSGDGRRLDDAVRLARPGPQVPLARCVAAGLRRLPSYRGAGMLRATFDEEQWRWFREQRVLTEWAFCSALTASHPDLPGDTDVLLWSMTARRTRLVDPAVPERVVFLPGTTFKVLAVQEEDGRTVLLRELAATEIDTDGRVSLKPSPMDDIALNGLAQARSLWTDAEPPAALPPRAADVFTSPPGLLFDAAPRVGGDPAPNRQPTTEETA